MPESKVMQSPYAGSVPNPDPTVRTVEQLQRDIGATREIVEAKVEGGVHNIETRLAGMDKAIELLQRTTDRIPELIKDEVVQLRDLHQEKFDSFSNQTKIQFEGIATQFAERDKRTEQLSLADKTAIAAALQAQKEAAGAQNEANSAANSKMEVSFAKLIDQQGILLQEVRRNTDQQVNDLKSRQDKSEGSSHGSSLAWQVATAVLGLLFAGTVAVTAIMNMGSSTVTAVTTAVKPTPTPPQVIYVPSLPTTQAPR